MNIEYLTQEEAFDKREKKQVVLDREFDRLLAKHKRIDVDLVLDEAKKKRSPLHPYFEWDDSVAADLYRRHQATNMLMASKFVVQITEAGRNGTIQAKPIRVRRLVSPFRNQGFVLRTTALNDAEMRQALIEKHLSKLRSWCNSVVDMEELSPIRKTILKALP